LIGGIGMHSINHRTRIHRSIGLLEVCDADGFGWGVG
jgi:hypothetical protein